jgi:hypothetical protein
MQQGQHRVIAKGRVRDRVEQLLRTISKSPASIACDRPFHPPTDDGVRLIDAVLVGADPW